MSSFEIDARSEGCRATNGYCCQWTISRIVYRSELTDMSDFYTRGSVNQTNKMLREETHHDQGLQLDRSRLGILGGSP